MKTFMSLVSLVQAHDTAVRKLSRLMELRGEWSAASFEEIDDAAPELRITLGALTGLGVEVSLKFTHEDIHHCLKILDQVIQAQTELVDAYTAQLKEHKDELLGTDSL
jgi:hypothetical protein